MSFHQDILDGFTKLGKQTVELGTARRVWATQSVSEDGLIHYVFALDMNGGMLFICTCRGYRFTDHCHHVEERKEAWDRDNT